MSPRTGRQDRGSVTVEAAVGLAALTLVLAACLAGLACVLAQLRCADAAREAARLAARGDRPAAEAAARDLAPDGAAVSFSESGGLVSVTVSAPPAGGLLPGIEISGEASAAREGGANP